MAELSIFVDESGDFGQYSSHSPYYIITMIFHNQDTDISYPLQKLESDLSAMGFPNHCVHVGPLVRREEDYSYLDVADRRRILNKMITFIKASNIKYKCFMIEKHHIEDDIETIGKLSKVISQFIKEHFEYFLSFNPVKVYYDNGQYQVTKILSSVLNSNLQNVKFRKVFPSDYRLFQVADLICSFKLFAKKAETSSFSKSEMSFFGTYRDFKKNYLKVLKAKEMN